MRGSHANIQKKVNIYLLFMIIALTLKFSYSQLTESYTVKAVVFLKNGNVCTHVRICVHWEGVCGTGHACHRCEGVGSMRPL